MLTGHAAVVILGVRRAPVGVARLTVAGRRARVFVVLAVVVSTIGCDRVTKSIAARHLAGRPRLSMISDSIRLEYAENRGGFLSLGTDLPDTVRRAIFNLGTAVLLVWLGVWLGRRAIADSWALGPALLWAGGAGNLVDRITRGSVIDFLNVGIGGFRTGIFNAADVAITAGMVLVVLQLGRQERTRRVQESQRLRSAPASRRRDEGVPDEGSQLVPGGRRT